MSASETGLRKSSQNTWSPSAFENKLSKPRQSYNIVTHRQTKRSEIKHTKLKTPHLLSQFNDELARFETIDTIMHVVEIERPVRRKPLPSSATRAAMYPSRA